MRPIILDCNNLAHISRHAFGEDLSYEEEQTGVMWGFLSTVLRLAKQFESHRFFFCWDSRKNYRKLEYPEYKANRYRDKTQGELESDGRIYAQFTKLQKEVLPAIGFRNIYHHTGWEADDIMAVILRELVVVDPMGEGAGAPVLVSTDKDLYQLLDHCVIYRPLQGDHKELITYKLFRERYGVVPAQWCQVRALEGDTSDNIPGIKGVGEKSAIKFVQGNLKPGTAWNAIRHDDAKVFIRRNVRLMRLPYEGLPKFDVLVDFPIYDEEKLSIDGFLKVCNQYGFNSFLKTNALADWRKFLRLE